MSGAERKVAALLAREDLARAFLGVAMLAAAITIWFETKDQTFWSDELTRMYARFGWSADSLLAPEQGNLVFGSVVAMKGFLAVFGADHALWRLVLIALNLLCSALLFIWLRRRIPAWFAALPAALILFLGAGGEAMATTLGASGLIPILAGLAALLVLDRGDRKGDLLACALLALGLSAYSIGIAFVIAAAVVVSFRPAAVRREEPLSGAWIWALPLALFAAWRIWVAVADPPLLSYPLPDQFSLANLYMVPSFMVRALAGACAALTGLFEVRRYPAAGFPATLGIPVAIALTALVVQRLVTARVELRRLLVVVLPPLALWASVALTYLPGLREPAAVRYVYVNAILVILVLGELARGVELTPRRWLLAAGVFFVALVPNVFQLHYEAQYVAGISRVTKAKLTALELAAGRVDPAFHPEGPQVVGRGDTIYAIGPAVTAGEYLDSLPAWGSPAFSVDELLRQSPSVRNQADLLLAQALGLRLEPAQGPPPGPCRELRPAVPGQVFELRSPGGEVRFDAARGAAVSVGRFGDGAPYPLGAVPPGGSSSLGLPPDRVGHPWKVAVNAAGPVTVCSPRANGA